MNRTYLTTLDAFNHEMSEALLDVDTPPPTWPRLQSAPRSPSPAGIRWSGSASSGPSWRTCWKADRGYAKGPLPLG